MTVVYVANRGEIALRVMRSCTDLGLHTAIGYSSADRESWPVIAADRSICIGPPRATESYLDIDRLMLAASMAGADVLHPGYGFLSENPELAEACVRSGIAFAGPEADTLRLAGNKTTAKSLASRIGVPVLEGTGPLASILEAEKLAGEIGYPVLLKAAAGGGGRGMAIASSADTLPETYQRAALEARETCGNATLFLEPYLSASRHIEVQIFGDGRGHYLHFGDRDCSFQRRHQKVIEEAPAPDIPARVRENIYASALALAVELRYRGAGTVEFLYDSQQERFYFLEINPRIQVEHPVTEMVTGLDIVGLQLKLALGNTIQLAQTDVCVTGHAIECRINAEDPNNELFPTPGRIDKWLPWTTSKIRVDSHCYSNYIVPSFYDSLLGKIIAFSGNRMECLELLSGALERSCITGIPTTLPLQQMALAHRDVTRGIVDTGWVERILIPEYTANLANASQGAA